MGLHSLFESAVESRGPLESIEAAIWQGLSAGASSSRHPWNHGVLNTAAFRGRPHRINSRVVILRRANTIERFLDCHTDVRSQKVADVSEIEAASWTFYDQKSKVQLRVAGKAAVLNDQQTDAAWVSTPLRSRAAYLSLETPGTCVESIEAPSTDDRNVSQEESERGRENFRIIRLQVEIFDWLYLRRGGHLRASIGYADTEIKTRAWLIP